MMKDFGIMKKRETNMISRFHGTSQLSVPAPWQGSTAISGSYGRQRFTKADSRPPSPTAAELTASNKRFKSTSLPEVVVSLQRSGSPAANELPKADSCHAQTAGCVRVQLFPSTFLAKRGAAVEFDGQSR